jgi:hypothetical protein
MKSTESKICVSTFLSMRGKWQPLVETMPFFDFCAGLIPSQQPFTGVGNYVFNPGRPLALGMIYTPEIVRYAAESEKSLISYCNKNNYTAYIYRFPIYCGIHPTWQKGRVVLNHIQNHEGVVWLDADTLILAQEKTVFAEILQRASLLHVSKDFSKGSAAFNGGVILFKNAPWVMELLRDWDEFALKNKPANLWDYGSDQKVLSDLILSRDPHGEFHEAHEMSEFNTDPRFMDENTFLLHFMAYPSGYKIPWMHFWNANHLEFHEADFVGRIRPL